MTQVSECTDIYSALEVRENELVAERKELAERKLHLEIQTACLQEKINQLYQITDNNFNDASQKKRIKLYEEKKNIRLQLRTVEEEINQNIEETDKNKLKLNEIKNNIDMIEERIKMNGRVVTLNHYILRGLNILKGKVIHSLKITAKRHEGNLVRDNQCRIANN